MELYYPYYPSMHLTKFRKSEKWKKIRNQSLLMKFMSTAPKVLFFKTTDLYTIPILWICKQLKHHQLRIRSVIFILLEITLNEMSLMFDSIIFDLNPYLGYSATFVHFSLHPLWICYAVRCVHFVVPSRRRGVLFFLWKQMYTSGSPFIKKNKPFVCHYISTPW